MKNKMKFIVICDKCGKEAPIDKEKSTTDWIAYKAEEHCDCGGKYVPKLI